MSHKAHQKCPCVEPTLSMSLLGKTITQQNQRLQKKVKIESSDSDPSLFTANITQIVFFFLILYITIKFC